MEHTCGVVASVGDSFSFGSCEYYSLAVVILEHRSQGAVERERKEEKIRAGGLEAM